MKSSKFVVPVITLIILISVAVTGFAAPHALRVAASIPNIFNMTLFEALGWFLSNAVWGAGVLFLLVQIASLWKTMTGQDEPTVVNDFLKAVFMAIGSILLTSLTAIIPPDIGGSTVGQLLLNLLALIPGWIGLKFFALRYAYFLSAGGAPKGASLALKVAACPDGED